MALDLHARAGITFQPVGIRFQSGSSAFGKCRAVEPKSHVLERTFARGLTGAQRI
jgi:hypothetical protein